MKNKNNVWKSFKVGRVEFIFFNHSEWKIYYSAHNYLIMHVGYLTIAIDF